MMAPDELVNNPYSLLFKEYGEWKTLEGGLSSIPNIGSSSYCGTDIDTLYPMTMSCAFKFDNKSWIKVQKALGLIKPIYKKRRKGKRYVWYEVI